MTDQTQPIRVEEIEWSTVLPFMRVFGAFRIAVQPSKLFLALTLVTVLWLLGQAMDAMWGPQAYQGEVWRYAHHSVQAHDRWIDSVREAGLERTGIYAMTLQFKYEAFEQLVDAMARLDFGFGQVTDRTHNGPHSVSDSLKGLFLILPGWLWHRHCGFLLTYGLLALAACAVFGGAIARMAALHATRNTPPPLADAIRYATSRWVWFFLTPALPLIFTGLVVAVLAAFGGIFFNLPILDVVGGLSFVVPLVCGVIITMLLTLWVTAGSLLYPAIAIEATDGFDAVSRAFGYVLGRPGRWLFYNLLLLVYGALTCLLVALVLCLTVKITRWSVGLLVINDAGPQLNRFDAIFPNTQQAGQDGDSWSQLDVWGKTAASMVRLWVHLVRLLLPAYAVSFYFSANTWIYLLLRRWTDGTEFDNVFVQPDGSH